MLPRIDENTSPDNFAPLPFIVLPCAKHVHLNSLNNITLQICTAIFNILVLFKRSHQAIKSLKKRQLIGRFLVIFRCLTQLKCCHL